MAATNPSPGAAPSPGSPPTPISRPRNGGQVDQSGNTDPLRLGFGGIDASPRGERLPAVAGNPFNPSGTPITTVPAKVPGRGSPLM
jgi:hypothetical protein